MRSWTSRILGVVIASFAFSAAVVADDGDPTVRWSDVVGVIQAGNAVGSGTGQVLGGGQPWTTLGGHVGVNLATGMIQFEVKGLVFAGGNTIGTPSPVTAVKGTLVCDTNGSAGGGNSTLVDTTVVPLDERGNAQFEGSVSIPSVCASEPDIAFLIRIPANGRWIANGAVLVR